MRNAHKYLVLLLLLALVGLAAEAKVEAEDAPASVQFVKKMGELKFWRAQAWRELGDLSYSLKLYSFAKVDDATAKSLGAAVEGRKYPDAPLPPNAVAAYTKWGEARKQMLAEFIRRCHEMIDWTAGNHKPGVRIAAELLLDEVPDDRKAHESLGKTWSPVLGWVVGEDAENVKKGLLPFGKRWLPEEEVKQLRSDWANAWEVDSPLFFIRTNTTPEIAQSVLRFLRNYREGWTRELGGITFSDRDKKLGINLFADRKTFMEVAKMIHSTAPFSGAFYSERTGQTYIPVYPGANDTGVRPDLLVHEHSHQFLNQFTDTFCERYYPKPGAWINEGLASYCETAQQFADRFTFCGFANTRWFATALAMKGAGKLLSLEDFANSTGTLFDHDGKDIRANDMWYSQGMALISYFMHGADGKYRQGFYKYVDGILRGRGDKFHFKRCFGMEPAAMEPEFLAWLESDVENGR